MLSVIHRDRRTKSLFSEFTDMVRGPHSGVRKFTFQREIVRLIPGSIGKNCVNSELKKVAEAVRDKLRHLIVSSTKS